MLKVTNLRAGYGKVDVLHGITLEVNASECVALVGANGAGKSTTLKCICGLIEARAGRIEFEGQRIDGLAGHSIVPRQFVAPQRQAKISSTFGGSSLSRPIE